MNGSTGMKYCCNLFVSKTTVMRTALLLLLAGGLFACGSNGHDHPAAGTFSIDSVRLHITEMNKTYGKRFTTNDSGFYVSRYCKDAEVYCPGLPAVKGREAIRSFFYSNGTNTDTNIELPPGNIYGNGDMVVEEGAYNFPDGKGGSVDKGKFIALWKQEDGTWKLYREIWNTDLAPKQ